MQHRRIIKRGPIILATDEDGSVSPSSPSSQGLFLSDTRYLSLFKIRVNDIEPVLLGSSEEDLFEASYLHTNAALPDIPERSLGCIHRNRIEGDEVVIDVTVLNWTLAPIKVEISIELDGDFFDSFEARGVQRVKRGAILTPMASGEMLDLHYVGLDGICNRTKVAVTPGMDRFENGRMIFPVALDGSERGTI